MDGHGDVVMTVNKDGNIQNQYDYDIFGNPILTIEETYENSIRYSGEFFDTETGLYYLRARYYNSYTGRFISEDSYWGEDTNPLSLNLYTYCYNDPIMYIDPTGHWGGKDGKFDDSQLSVKDQRKIKDITDAWHSAEGNTAEQERLHKQAQSIRKDALKNGTINKKNQDSFGKKAQSIIKEKGYITKEDWKSISKKHNRRSKGEGSKRKSEQSFQKYVGKILGEAEDYSDYVLGTKDYVEEINILFNETISRTNDMDITYRTTVKQMNKDKQKYGHELEGQLASTAKYLLQYTKFNYGWSEEITKKLDLDDRYSDEFKQKMISYYKQTGKGIDSFFNEHISPEEQDVDILSDMDLMSVKSLKATYAVYSQQNDTEKMYAVLRAIDTIRSKSEYNGEYDFKDTKGNYISMYTYHNKKITSKLHIAHSDPARDSAIVNSGLTLLGLAPFPYNALSVLFSAGLQDEFTASTAVDLGIGGVGMIKGGVGTFFTVVGGITSSINTVTQYNELKNFTDMHVTVQDGSIYETHKYRFTPHHYLIGVGKPSKGNYPVPAQFRYLNENSPHPDIELDSGEKYFFNN